MNPARMLIDVELEPAIGSRFQPTGFPDLGAAEFRRPKDDSTCLIVESAQSMANHLEGAAWDDASNEPVDVFAELPFVRVVGTDGRYLTSSRTESHRLASAFVKDSTLDGNSMVDVLRERLRLRDDTPLDHREIARAIFRLDPFALVHGVFFADKAWPGQPKVARALTAFVEAVGVQRAESGGVKKDHVRHSNTDDGGSSEGYGSVPFARTEWTARQILASFSLDRRQLHSYGLGEAGAKLLEDIALWEIRSLLDEGLRLRTACDLVPVSDTVTDRSGAVLPSFDELSESVGAGVHACADLLDGAGVVEVVWSGGKKKAKG